MIDITFSQGSIYPDSVVSHDGTTYFLATLHSSGQRALGLIGDTTGFTPTAVADQLTLCPLTPENANALRQRLPWLMPVTLGQQTSFGFGDRLGSATPGHIQAVNALPPHTIAPIFAQQSVRENSRIHRTPQQVMDDAMWGLFQAGWQSPWGADADHVKEIDHLAPFVQAGYTFYTIDPSDYVDNEAETDTLATLQTKAATLPWAQWQTNLAEIQQYYCQRPFAFNGLSLTFTEEILLRALAKYGRAFIHALNVSQQLTTLMQSHPYELEMSVDETDTPTSAHEHFFIANELHRANLPIVSIAPRFIGKFQKGVDYIGDLAEFEQELAKHVAIMDHFGSYKISVHTGSDKFSLYPIIARLAHGRVHVKTAGTSYLEALRVLSQHDPATFRHILNLAHERFATDRKTYYLDCQPENVPASHTLSDAELPTLLEQFDARQLLHVTFGSALDVYGRALHTFLHQHQDAYTAVLVTHFLRHLRPFAPNNP